MNRPIIFSIIISLALFCTSSAYAETGRGMGPGMGQGMGPGMMDHDEYMERMRRGGGYGQGKGYGMGMHGKGGMHGYCFSYMSVMDELDLSDEQAEKLRKKKSSFRKEQIRLKAAMKVAKIDYKDLLSEEKVDMKAVEKKVRKIADLVAEQMMNSAKASSEMRMVLSKEQRTKSREFMRKRKQQCGMFGRWPDKKNK